MKNNHIVYAAFDSKGNCLYVGEGKPDRYKHITSGVSHVYEANKWHFANKKVVVKILHTGLTKEQAVEKEKLEIDLLSPVWNRANSTHQPKLLSFAHNKLMEAFRKNKREVSNKDDYIQLNKDLCNLMNGSGCAVILKGQKWTNVKTPISFMSHLAKDGDKYYAPLKYVYDVVRDNSSGTYTITLKDWISS